MKRAVKPLKRQKYRRVKRQKTAYVTKPHVTYKPKHRRLQKIKVAKPTPHVRLFRKSPKRAVPKAPFRHEHKSEYKLNPSFVLLLLLLLLLLGALVFLIMFVLKQF